MLLFTKEAMNSKKKKNRLSKDLLKRLGISLLFVWPALPFRLILSGGPKWPENSCVSLDPQLLLCPDIFISVAYLWQQCLCKGPSELKRQTDYMTSEALLLILKKRSFSHFSTNTCCDLNVSVTGDRAAPFNQIQSIQLHYNTSFGSSSPGNVLSLASLHHQCFIKSIYWHKCCIHYFASQHILINMIDQAPQIITVITILWVKMSFVL